MATRVVVGGILLSGDEAVWAKQLTVLAGPDLVDYGGLKVYKDGSWNVFACGALAEAGTERLL